MNKKKDDIEWIDNPGVIRDRNIGIIFTICFLLFSIIFFLIVLFLGKFNGWKLFISLLAFLLPITAAIGWFFGSKRNVAKKVGYSKKGVYFRHLGKDKFIKWTEIETIMIKRYYIEKVPKMKLKTGEVLILGFIDKELTNRMLEYIEKYG